MEIDDSGAGRGAGQGCPALKGISGGEGAGELPSEKLDEAASLEVRLAEEAILRHLKEEASERRSWLGHAVLQWASALLLSGAGAMAEGGGAEGDGGAQR